MPDLQDSRRAHRELDPVYNRGRELMKQLYELRKRDRPPVTGAEALEVSKAAGACRASASTS